MTASPISPPARTASRWAALPTKRQAKRRAFTGPTNMGHLTAQDADAGLRLTDGDSFGLTLAGLTTASLSADYFPIL